MFVTIGIFQIKFLKFQTCICNGCCDLYAISINLNDIPVINLNGINYRCIISGINKSEVVNLLQNANLSEKSDTLQNAIFLTVHKNG